MNLIELAERCEGATAERQDLLLRQAFMLMFPEPDRQYQDRLYFTPEYAAWSRRDSRFRQLMSVKAFLDAIVTLLPSDCDWWAGATCGSLGSDIEVAAATPALALCAATLRARAA